MGKDRPEALRRMEISLEEIIIEGIRTTVAFHLVAMHDQHFQRGDLDTHFVDRLLPAQVPAAAT